MMQVHHELALLDVIIIKLTKLKKIHSMAMDYKTEFEHVNGCDTKSLMEQWSKSKYLHKYHLKPLKTVMHFDKHKSNVKHKPSTVKLKHLKHNKLYARPLEPLKSATAKCENKRKLFVARYKKKPPDAKSNKKGATKRTFLALLQDKSDTKWNKCFKTLLHAKSDIMRNEHLRTFQGKSDITTAIKMKNSATASSSSPCQSSPEAMIPKNISLGH